MCDRVGSPSPPVAISELGKTHRLDLANYMIGIQKKTDVLLESACAAGRHETALRAIREARSNVELISKLEGLREAEGTLDLCRLSSQQLGILLRASLGELSARDRQRFLLEAPELADLAPDSV
jgi:hypothetical protein